MKLDRILILCGLGSFLLFFIGFFFVFPSIYPDYDIRFMSISSLGANDSPIMTIVNVFGFSLLGILTMLFGLGIYRHQELKYGKLEGWLIGIGGFIIYLVGVFPSDGLPGVYSLSGLLHSVEHFAFIPIPLAFLIMAYEFLTNDRLRWLIFPIVILGLASLVLKFYRFTSNYEIPYSGLVQRSAIGLPFLIIGLISIGLYKMGNK